MRVGLEPGIGKIGRSFTVSKVASSLASLTTEMRQCRRQITPRRAEVQVAFVDVGCCWLLALSKGRE